MKRWLAAFAVLLALTAAVLGYLEWQARRPWAEWEAFARDFIQDDGRVVDRTAGGRSVSEAQAYALFFALVANDRARFERMLAWTRDNLAGGDLRQRLPAWLWGRRDDGSWGVIDANPASDADLWLGYVLLEAGRLWQQPAHAELGAAVLDQVVRQEVVASAAGTLLLPGPQGFRLPDGRWRLNPSYLPQFQLHYLAQWQPQGPWRALWSTYQALLPQIAPARLAPDWILLDEQGRVSADTVLPARGGYDAIRTYLWAGISAEAGLGREGLTALRGYAALIPEGGAPPEFVDPYAPAARGGQPLGFSGAVLPYLEALDETTKAREQRQRLEQNRVGGSLGQPAHYYDQVLALFGQGWASGRYRIDSGGRVKPRWEHRCCER
ncbi:MAG TPA: cellulose synthase complex periplasmic endoglucanase BcsZ [Nevskiaceae bacterium]|nr:cellulose synthase complex periplasmic endoglucanase BcsZ [Nevskiaceae bacterium]